MSATHGVVVVPRETTGKPSAFLTDNPASIRNAMEDSTVTFVTIPNGTSFVSLCKHDILSIAVTERPKVSVEPHPTVCIDQYVTDPVVKAQVDAAYNATSSFKEEEKLLKAFLSDNPSLVTTVNPHPQGC